MNGFRLLSFDDGGKPTAGVLIADRVHQLSDVLDADVLGHRRSVRGLLRIWDKIEPALGKAAKNPPGGGVPLAGVKLLAPILYPGNVIFVGANYWDHMREMDAFVKTATGKDTQIVKHQEPWVSMHASTSSIVGPDVAVEIPDFTTKLDWEAEIALVIGREAKNLTMKNALDCLAGYTIANDLSLRDHLKKENHPFIYDWFAQKCFDGSLPMGPWLTPASEIKDPDEIGIKLWLNGEIRQDSNTSQLVHDFREILVYVSKHLTLQPGDVIATGTPAGVGMPSGVFLKPGDKVLIEIEGLGKLATNFK